MSSALRVQADWAAWRAQVLGTLRSASAPRIAASVVGLALAISVIKDAASLIGLARTPPLDAVRTTVSSAQRVSVETIAAAHLFGAVPAADAAPPAEEKALILTGTVATDDPAVGYAFLGTVPEKTRFFAVGQQTPEGATLREVYADHVLIERDGHRFTVALPRRLDLLTGGGAVRRVARAAAARSRGPTTDEMTSTLNNESNRLAAVLTEKPYFLGDQLIGVQIEPGSSPALLKQLGLEPGDILKAVDGVLVTPERLDWLRTHLASGKPIRLAGTRLSGGQFNVTVNSSKVAGMISQ